MDRSVEVDHLVERVAEIARDRGATTVRVSNDEKERVLFWAGRKAAFPAVGTDLGPTTCASTVRCRAASSSKCWPRCVVMSKKYGLRVGERLPCRRRQPASYDLVRRQ